jgi:hypothetical protein
LLNVSVTNTQSLAKLVKKSKPGGLLGGLLFYFILIGGRPKSLQIFLPKKVLISVCLGTVEACPEEELMKTVCLDPSRTTKHPANIMYFTKSFLFMPQVLRRIW